MPDEREMKEVKKQLEEVKKELAEAKKIEAAVAATAAGPKEVNVSLHRSITPKTPDLALWVVIRNSTNALAFGNYETFLNGILCPTDPNDRKKMPCTDAFGQPLAHSRLMPFPDMDAYRILKVATECFEMVNCGVYIDPEKLPQALTDADLLEESARFNRDVTATEIQNLWAAYLTRVNGNETIPYLALIRARLGDLSLREDYETGVKCYGILKKKLIHPCLIELIWSYWHEEGMLVQTLNAISQRFQNLRGAGDRDPLTRFDIDPLRPLNNLLWGYIQDEQHRLTVRRRAYEYNHHYGLALEGKAVPMLRPSDSRSKFLEAFHNLLYLCTIFFKQDDDTTVIADGFPVLNALKEVHYVLAEGAHNQFGDLPSTARQEMLIQEWLLARPEMREFLGGKIMVPYPEEWMDRVDSVKSMEGWTDVSVIHFHNLAVYGEQIVLSVRYGAWSITNNPAQAANWARYWRPEIQGYVHAYRAATGVDLTTEPVSSTLPSQLLAKRLATQRAIAP